MIRLSSIAVLLASCSTGAGAAPVQPPLTAAVSEASSARAAQGDDDLSEAASTKAPPLVELRMSKTSLPIRTKPASDASLRGYTAEGASFRVLRRTEGTGNCKAGWALLEADGFLCLDGTESTELSPVAWPPLVTFDPPEPAEFEKYKESGIYDHGQPEALVPAVYAKRWGRFKGRLYSSLDAFTRGESSTGQLEPGAGMKYRFERIVETEKGAALLRDDGKVARLDDVYLYPVTRHHGYDLVAEPLPAEQWPAFTIAYEGAPVRSEPREDAPVLRTLPYHTPVRIDKAPADKAGRWWRLTDGGYLDDISGLRHPVPSPGRPSGVGDNELWVDVELDQQSLMVLRGDALVYFTVVATGAAPKGTPKGIYNILGMYAFKNMQSREGADDVYFVEDVPWTMVFKPAYALHAAYWHWGFGRTASHGCVNLAPKDAAWLFSHLEPKLPDGWRTILTPTADGPSTSKAASTVVRIRRGSDFGEDQRK